MKYIKGKPGSAWKTVVSLIFCALALSACKKTNETNAGICNGDWGLVAGWVCDIGFPGNEKNCFIFAKDVDRNGAYRSNTSDVCILDYQMDQEAIDCDKMCRDHDCSKVRCPAAQDVERIDKRLNIKKQPTSSDPLTSP